MTVEEQRELRFAAFPAFFSAFRSALSERRRREGDSSCASAAFEDGGVVGSWPAALCSLRGAEKAVRLAASQASPASWVKDPSGAPDLAAARDDSIR